MHWNVFEWRREGMLLNSLIKLNHTSFSKGKLPEHQVQQSSNIHCSCSYFRSNQLSSCGDRIFVDLAQRLVMLVVGQETHLFFSQVATKEYAGNKS